MLQETYTTKLIVSGNRLEIVNYEKEIRTNQPSYGGRRYKIFNPSDNALEYRKVSNSRAISKFRRLVHCNFSTNSSFLTLTFSPELEGQLSSIKGYKILFNQFMKKLRIHYPTVKHLAVIEFQSDRDLAGLHFHVLLDIDFLSYSLVSELWTNGIFWLTQVNYDTLDKLAFYMTKAIDDSRLAGIHLYLRSKQLKLPQVITGTEALQVMKDIDFDNQKLVTSRSFESKYLGVIQHDEYQLNTDMVNVINNLPT